MPTIGYAAAMEQFHPTELLAYAKLAEQHGFKNVMAADHFQPWVPSQGHSAFAWSWMGARGPKLPTAVPTIASEAVAGLLGPAQAIRSHPV